MPSKAGPLRAVKPGEKAQARPKSVTDAADRGTTRELLAAMRARIATAVEDPNTPARDLAALTKRLVEVVKEIEAIDARDEDGDPDDADVDTDETFDAASL